MTAPDSSGEYIGMDKTQEIASDLLDYIAEKDGVCLDVSVHAGRHPYIRKHGDLYEIVETSGYGRVEVTACDKDALLNLVAENPANVIPDEDATFSPKESGRANIWEYIESGSDEVVYV